MTKNKLAVALAAVLFAAIATLYIILYTIPELTGSRTQTVVVEYGLMEISTQQQCLVVRDEELVYAQKSGSVNYYVDENTKTRKGIKILDIVSGGEIENYTCSQTGIISYYKDGLESEFSPENIEELTKEQIQGSAREASLVKTDEIREGDVAYKLIKSEAWNVVFCVNVEEGRSYNVGDKITLRLEQGDVAMSVSSIIRRVDKDETLIILQTVKYFADFTHLRYLTADIIVSSAKGIIVPNTAIAEVDGKLGVYVRNVSDGYDFTRINVLADNGEESCVSTDSFEETQEDGTKKTILTLSNYDEILKNASEMAQ